MLEDSPIGIPPNAYVIIIVLKVKVEPRKRNLLPSPNPLLILLLYTYHLGVHHLGLDYACKNK